MFAHSLEELEVPNEGQNGEYEWSHAWRDNKVDRWYGQYEGRPLMRKYYSHEHMIREDKRLIPDWAHAWAIIHLSHVPVVPPKCGLPDWGMQDALTELAKKRWQEKVPQTVPPVLDPDFVLRLKTAFEDVMSHSSRPSGLSRRSPPEIVLQQRTFKNDAPEADDLKAVHHDPNLKAVENQDREGQEQEGGPDLPEAAPKSDPHVPGDLDVPDDPKAEPRAVQPQADPNMTPKATTNCMPAKIEGSKQTGQFGSGCAAAISHQDPDVELPTSPKSLAAPPPQQRFREPKSSPEEDDPETVSPKAEPKSSPDVSELVLAEKDPESRPEAANFKQGGN